MNRFWTWTLCALFALPTMAQGATKWTQDEAVVSYKIVHKFHEVEGVSKKVEVVALLDGDTLKVMARAPVASFDSGNANRDEHVMEVVDGVKFPVVVVKILLPKFALPAPGAPEQEFNLPGEVELHGEKVKLTVVTKVKVAADQALDVTFAFADTLEGHKIERPQLMFVKVDDAMQVKGHAKLHVAK